VRRGYDLVVVGGGAAGFSAIVKYRELAGPGRSVALVSKRPLGGTCVNVGCVPSKYLIEAAKIRRVISRLHGRGVRAVFSLDFKSLMSSMREFIGRLRSERYESLLEYYGVDFYEGEALFTSPRTLEVRGGEGVELEFKAAIVATGSRPSMPRIDGLESVPYYTTDTIWSLEELPSTMLVIGGGAVGVELAQALSRLGSKVDIVEVLDRLLPNADPLVSRVLTEVLEGEGVGVLTKSRVAELSREGGLVRARIVTPKGTIVKDYEVVLVAAGRRPNSDGLGLERAGVEVDSRGFIRVSEDLRTSNPSIYAAGDVAGTPKPAFLETLAAREGAIAAQNIALGTRLSIDYESVPVVVFTDPEVAYVGLTEEALTKIKGACSCRIAWFEKLPKSGIVGEYEGVAKIVVDPEDGSIRGFHTVAPNASEFIGVAALMVKHRYKVEDVINIILAFPTSAELLKLAAQAYLRRPDRMPCCVE